MRKNFFALSVLLFFASSAVFALDTDAIKKTLNEALLKMSEQNLHIQNLNNDLATVRKSLMNSDTNLQEAGKKIDLLSKQLEEAKVEAQKLKDSILKLEALLKKQSTDWILPTIGGFAVGIGAGILIDYLFIKK
jgi:peptidoglycan hydrolase CwlO-like protein